MHDAQRLSGGVTADWQPAPAACFLHLLLAHSMPDRRNNASQASEAEAEAEPKMAAGGIAEQGLEEAGGPAMDVDGEVAPSGGDGDTGISGGQQQSRGDAKMHEAESSSPQVARTRSDCLKNNSALTLMAAF